MVLSNSGPPRAGPPGKVWYSVLEAARFSGLSVPALLSLVRRGDLPAYRIGGALCFAWGSLDAIIHTHPAADPGDATGRCPTSGMRLNEAAGASEGRRSGR